MYSPDGFISLLDVRSVLGEIAESWTVKNPHPDDPSLSRSPDFIEDPWDTTTRIREFAYADWLFQCFLNSEERNLFACLANGAPLKLSALAVQRYRLYAGEFIDTPDGWSSISDHCREPFTFVDPVYLAIATDRVTDRFNKAMFGASLSYLAPLNGCPVCWKLPPKPMIENDWLEVCGISRSNPSRSGGRPEKVSTVIAAYLSEFPSGHGALSRKEVVGRLSARRNIFCSVDTLDKALKQINMPKN